MIDKSAFGKFSSFGNRRWPEMTVTATIDGKQETYRTPAGFRLDAFVASRHPDKNVQVTFQSKPDKSGNLGMTVTVTDLSGETVEKHEGVYDESR